MSFAIKMKEVRTKKHLSQADLEKRCGVSQSGISAIERGERSPTEETMRMIAKALHVPLSDLLDEQEKKPAAESDELRESVVNLLLDLPQEDLRQILDYVSWLKSHHEGQ